MLIWTSIRKDVREGGEGEGEEEYINCDLTTAKRFLYSLKVE